MKVKPPVLGPEKNPDHPGGNIIQIRPFPPDPVIGGKNPEGKALPVLNNQTVVSSPESFQLRIRPKGQGGPDTKDTPRPQDKSPEPSSLFAGRIIPFFLHHADYTATLDFLLPKPRPEFPP
jgi:hypothetical protein